MAALGRSTVPRAGRHAAVAFAVCLLLPAIGVAQTQMELNRQAGEELQRTDRRLNEVYSKLWSRLSTESRARLQAAEEAWIRFRDQECAFVSSSTIGGSIHPMMIAQCKARLTALRVKDIEVQLDCAEGDLACVHN